jgi:transcriptional regulator with XRE-family HTH domain
MAEEEERTGKRLRRLRRAQGMSLGRLAGLSGLSKSFLSMVETGQRSLDRRSDIARIAAALRISETELSGGPHLTADRDQSEPHYGIPALRVALTTASPAAPAVDRARPLADLARVVREQAEPMRRSCDYTSLGRVLPAVLDELHWHAASPASEAARRAALTALVDACTCATFLAKGLTYPDLAHLAALRAREAAVLLEDPVAQGKAEFAVLNTLPRAGAGDRSLAAARRAAAALEPHASDREGLSVLGMLTLHAALSAAVLQQGSEAAGWLEAASRIAARVPDAPDENWQSFSTANVAIWRVGVAVERGESGSPVLALAQAVPVRQFGPHSSRRADLLIDTGRGLARDARTWREAVRALRQAEEAGPQRARNSPAAREAVAHLLDRARATASSAELRGLAARLGLDP